jgi:UDP-N-acetylglucosamine 2-epimerase (non-hydrolysing)
MIDTLISHREKARALTTLADILANFDNSHELNKLESGLDLNKFSYGVVTLHRPSNVDTPEALGPLMKCLGQISSRIPLIFPLHPRTRNNLKQFGLLNPEGQSQNIIYTNPLGYLDFLNLLLSATLVLTDSGGIQEETTFLRVPCITLRNNTERPVTVTMGTNYLVGTDQDNILKTAFAVIDGNQKEGHIPPLWDGNASARIIEILSQHITKTGAFGAY